MWPLLFSLFEGFLVFVKKNSGFGVFSFFGWRFLKGFWVKTQGFLLFLVFSASFFERFLNLLGFKSAVQASTAQQE